MNNDKTDETISVPVNPFEERIPTSGPELLKSIIEKQIRDKFGVDIPGVNVDITEFAPGMGAIAVSIPLPGMTHEQRLESFQQNREAAQEFIERMLVQLPSHRQEAHAGDDMEDAACFVNAFERENASVADVSLVVWELLQQLSAAKNG